MMISTHVLDTSIGRPARSVDVRLAFQRDDDWQEIAHAATDANGRVGAMVSDRSSLPAGTYRLTFDVGTYFRGRGVESFYANVAVEFIVRDAAAHHHVPLLVSPYGYSTYRGS